MSFNISQRIQDIFWYDDENRLHRQDGPAIEYADGGRAWLKHGLMHRLAGPAVVYAGGHTEWWIDNRRYDQAEHALLAFIRV